MPLKTAFRLTSLFNALTRRHLEWLFRVTTTRPRAVLGAFFISLLISVAVISTTRFDSDIFQLFPSRQPALKLLLDSLQWSGSANEAYFLLEGESQELPREAARFAERLRTAQVDGKPAFRRITWRVFDESEAASFTDFIAYAVTHPQLFIGPDDVPALLQRFTPASMDESLRRTQADLAGQFGGAMTGLASADPLQLRDLILPRLKAASQALDLDPDSPYFISRDGKVLIMIAEPARPVQDMVFARALVATINQARQGSTVAISCAGAHISAVLDEAAMKFNILACIISSLVVVLAIFYAVYRRLLPTLLLPLIISVGVILALGVAGALLPSIHIISFAFMALIVGLGTDYSIHLYDRFHSERAGGRDSEEALHLAVVDTGHSLFTAATTTSMPFFALMLSDVRALSELGLLVGLGVLFSLYTTFFFLPPLLVFMEKRFPATYLPIPGLGMRHIWRLAGRFPRAVVTLSLLIVVIMAAASTRTFFDGDLKNLQPRHSEAFLAQEKIERHLSLAPKQLLVAVEGKALAEVLRRASLVDGLAGRWLSSGRISSWSSLGQIVNNRDRQSEVSRGITAGAEGGLPVMSLNGVLEKQGFETRPFQPFIAALSGGSALTPVPEEEALARLKASPLRGVVERHLVKDANGYHALLYLYYRNTGFDQSAFLRELSAIDPTARVTSVDLVSSQLATSVRQGFLRAFLVGGLLVLFLLLSHFKSPGGIFYTMFPIIAGSLAMLGLMAFSGMGLNFMNVMVLVTIIGMGSDYGLHLSHRISTGDPQGRESRFIQAGRAVIMSALTTIAGFGSLALADYPALASIGWATNFGVGCTALFALVTLPAVMVLLLRRREAACGQPE
ncbi:MAG: MMPL family transporter [Desulfuromonadaceae bacterium]|nr:MMPL family transporter [Desulfuromonadaceae bacterium]MDD2848531.1 MMPL family transporter [Desulfuromonadaceae bacterium]MDD4131567.1 MMPL family transporter [Desulfuromonadaceae bacterium]